MITLAVSYNWMGVHFAGILPMPLPTALPALTPVRVIRKVQHKLRLKWFTSGFL